MKLHFSIPAAEELREGHGGRYVVGLGSGWVCGWVVGGSVMALTALCLQLYSLFLEGFLLGKARYRQLRRWDEQVRAGIQPFPLSLLPRTPLPLRNVAGEIPKVGSFHPKCPHTPLGGGPVLCKVRPRSSRGCCTVPWVISR